MEKLNEDLHRFVSKINENKEKVLKLAIGPLLGREPLLEDAKRITLVSNLQHSFEKDVMHVFFDNKKIGKLVTTFPIYTGLEFLNERVCVDVRFIPYTGEDIMLPDLPTNRIVFSPEC